MNISVIVDGEFLHRSGPSQDALVEKKLPTSGGDGKDAGSIPGSGKMRRRRKGQLSLVFLPGESQGRRSGLHTVHGVAEFGHD